MIGGFLDFLCNIQEQNKHANLGKANMRKVHNDDRNLQNKKRDQLIPQFSIESFGKMLVWGSYLIQAA